MYTLEKINTLPFCILYTLMPQITPLLRLTLVVRGMKCPALDGTKSWETQALLV